MIIVSSDGDTRLNYNNVESIELRQEEDFYIIYAVTISGRIIILAKTHSLDEADKILVGIDKFILESEASKSLNYSTDRELQKDFYKDVNLCYVAECGRCE